DKAGAMPASGPGGSGGFAGVTPAPVAGGSADAVSALENLGFKPAIAAQAVARAQAELGEGASMSDLIRVALKKAAS
ncbi:MAG: Holliday junction branch migration protein RuvA, partial [Erythrobacter sp.]|nr:Holliday junction branch migration protein RuvA [Erythrobacter sp.]